MEYMPVYEREISVGADTLDIAKYILQANYYIYYRIFNLTHKFLI